jgi:hypothetical protein
MFLTPWTHVIYSGKSIAPQEQEKGAGSCECGNELSGSIKFGEISWLAKNLLDSQEGLSSIELLSQNCTTKFLLILTFLTKNLPVQTTQSEQLLETQLTLQITEYNSHFSNKVFPILTTSVSFLLVSPIIVCVAFLKALLLQDHMAD